MFKGRFVAGCFALYGLLGCQVLFGYEDFERGVQASTESCASAEDPGRHGPPMAKLTRADGSCFWIDTTEVTVADYTAFLSAAPPPQSGVCSWNTTPDDGAAPGANGFEPDAACRQMVQVIADDAGNVASDQLPITCIDWCDALAFCEWAGKELCEDGASAVPSASGGDWLAACSGIDDTRLYGCTAECSASTCNGSSAAAGGLAPVAAFPECSVSAAAQSVFDLSGNAAEWTGSCNDETKAAACMVRGGAYDTDDAALQCRNWSEAPRSRVRPALGFRCCAGTN